MRRTWRMVIALLLLGSGCGRGGNVESEMFFPTWDPDGPVPGGIVQGVLVEEDRCLFIEAHGQRTLVLWEIGLGFEEGALLDPAGAPIAEVGELIHGGGGCYDDRDRFERLAEEQIPDRCMPDGAESFAMSYGVEAGPFECAI